MDTRTSTIFKISGQRELPTLPHVYAKLIDAYHEKHISLSKIAAIVNMDPALSHKVMAMACSANNCRQGKIESIEEAVSIIGGNGMEALVSHVLTRHVFAETGIDSIDHLKSYWMHVIACAHACELIAKEIRYPNPSEAFLSGLLHDIGKLCLLTDYPNKYKKLFYQEVVRSEDPLAEEKKLGLDHCKTGARLIHTWGRQTFIPDAILYHHHSLDNIKNAFPLVQIVYLANILAGMNKERQEAGNQAAQELFGFNDRLMEEISTHMAIKVHESVQFLGLNELEKDDDMASRDFYRGTRNTIRGEVRDSSLLTNLIQNLLEAEDRNAIIQAVKQSIWVLFDVKDFIIFLYDPHEEMLIAQLDDFGADAAMRISIKIQDCLPVSTLLQKEIVDSFTRSSYSELTILDTQLTNRLGKEGMLCIPLITKETMIGCIILGVDKVAFPFLSKQFKLLNLIARKSAAALYGEWKRDAKIKTALSQQETVSTTKMKKIVHEANNPLGIIKNYLKLLEIRLSEQEISCDEIRIINEEINRVGLILKRLTSKETMKAHAKEMFDLNMILSDMARLLGETFNNRGRIKIHLSLDDSLPKACIDKDSIKQIAINLLKNATEAMPDGGNIYIQTIYVADQTRANTQQATNNMLGIARIIIRDNGPGIPETILSSLFESQVTSKPNHEGLGLSIVKNLIQKLNGSIECGNSENGAIFTIEIPLEKN